METIFAIIRTDDEAVGYEMDSEPYKLQWLAHHPPAREVLVEVNLLRPEGLSMFRKDYPFANIKADGTIPASWENNWEMLSFPTANGSVPRNIDVAVRHKEESNMTRRSGEVYERQIEREIRNKREV